ncbi:LexA family protein [Vreelandella malpeensis]|uniref:Peptidase S24/S26A/S26B/S26C domain-containing protein n=1 Tax=Vreelandella malpeensis TaxID=1172368 RepID=A0ABS8DUL5_9GAMM|nr:XRE family transcriptional regulator [Halomonas malpeensis]MCB8889958.1 hypothetical protein [Halomonas malpeensis]
MDIELFKDRIRQAIMLAKKEGHTQAAIGEEAGVTPQAVGQWPRSGKITNDNLAVLARLSKTPIEWFYNESFSREAVAPQEAHGKEIGPAPAITGLCPEISWVQAGHWAEVCDINHDPETTNWFPRPPGASPQTFVLKVVGESMLPDYPPGRFIFVDPEKIAASNDDVIAVMTETNEATFKRLIEEPGSPRMLKALNPAWKNPYLEINGSCNIIGVVIADMRMRHR